MDYPEFLQLVDFLDEQLQPDQAIGPSAICLLIAKFADLRDVISAGGEVFWLTELGYMTEFPYVWKGKAGKLPSRYARLTGAAP